MNDALRIKRNCNAPIIRSRRANNKMDSLDSSSSGTFFIVWLLRFAAKVGDKLPFGDTGSIRTEISLPYPTKSQVHQIYTTFAIGKDITDTGKPLSLTCLPHLEAS
jgi:hypothetical protein